MLTESMNGQTQKLKIKLSTFQSYTVTVTYNDIGTITHCFFVVRMVRLLLLQ